MTNSEYQSVRRGVVDVDADVDADHQHHSQGFEINRTRRARPDPDGGSHQTPPRGRRAAAGRRRASDTAHRAGAVTSRPPSSRPAATGPASPRRRARRPDAANRTHKPDPTTAGATDHAPDSPTDSVTEGVTDSVTAGAAGALDDGVLPLYTPTEAARLLAVPESWLRRRVTARAVPCTFLGKHLRFSHADVLAIARAAAVAPSASSANINRGVRDGVG